MLLQQDIFLNEGLYKVNFALKISINCSHMQEQNFNFHYSVLHFYLYSFSIWIKKIFAVTQSEFSTENKTSVFKYNTEMPKA